MKFFSLLLVILLALSSSSRSEERVRIAFGSCIREVPPKLFARIGERDPHLFLLLGDNIYLPEAPEDPSSSIGVLYARLVDHPSMKRLAERTKVYATWDDHDFGWDNADASYPFKKVTYGAFRRFFPNNPLPPPELSESVAFSVELPGVLLIVTDGRTYRRREGGAKEPAALFGARQIEWFERLLRETRARVAVFATGSQALPKYGRGEGLFQYPDEQPRVLRALAASPATPVILSGDRHMAEILKREVHGRSLVELTSSPLHADVAPPYWVAAEPDRVGVFRNAPNFGLLEIAIEEQKTSLFGGMYTEEGEEVLSFGFSEARSTDASSRRPPDSYPGSESSGTP